MTAEQGCAEVNGDRMADAVFGETDASSFSNRFGKWKEPPRRRALDKRDVVANRVTWRGVHSGNLAGVPATGRPIELRGINMFRVRDGRVVEQWAQLDMLGLLQQIGAIPS